MGTVVILLGAPGAGKGTQARLLSETLGLPHIATGDLFRMNIAQETELGQTAKSYLENGRLVPDDLVVDMLFDRVASEDCAGGYLLDGFPRTLAQARILDERMPPEWRVTVTNLEVPDEMIVERASGRLLCRNCTNLHHVTFSPPVCEGVCDVCGGELYRRRDDVPDVVRARLAVYHEQTQPVEDYYRGRDALCIVDGSEAPDRVFDSLVKCVGAQA